MAVGEDAQLGARAGALARVAEQRAARPADGGQSRAEGDGGVEHRGRPLAHLGGALGRLDEARRARAAREAQKLRLEPDLHRTKLRRPPADGVEAQPLERLEVLGAIEQVGANLVVEAQRRAGTWERRLSAGAGACDNRMSDWLHDTLVIPRDDQKGTRKRDNRKSA